MVNLDLDLPVKVKLQFQRFQSSDRCFTAWFLICQLILINFLSDRIKGKPQTLGTFLKVLGCLSFRDKEKMSLIFDYYGDSLNFFYYDDDSNADSSLKVSD